MMDLMAGAPTNGKSHTPRRSLEQDGLTEYARNPAHQRSQLVRIKPLGRKALSTIQRAQRVWADRVGNEIGESELRQAGAVVDNLTRILKTH